MRTRHVLKRGLRWLLLELLEDTLERYNYHPERPKLSRLWTWRNATSYYSYLPWLVTPSNLLASNSVSIFTHQVSWRLHLLSIVTVRTAWKSHMWCRYKGNRQTNLSRSGSRGKVFNLQKVINCYFLWRAPTWKIKSPKLNVYAA